MENKYKVLGMYEYSKYIDSYYHSSYKDLDSAIEEAKWAQAQEDECDYPRVDKDGNECDCVVYFNVYLVDEEDNYQLMFTTKKRRIKHA